MQTAHEYAASANCLHKQMNRPEINLVIETFPEMASAIRRLYLASPGFRDLCAEFALARAALDGFEQRADASSRPEIAEYREIIRCLATDIADLLRRTELQSPGGVAR